MIPEQPTEANLQPVLAELECCMVALSSSSAPVAFELVWSDSLEQRWEALQNEGLELFALHESRSVSDNTYWQKVGS